MNYTISLVNVAGLANRFHKNCENIVKVEFYQKKNGQVFKGETMSYRFGDVVKKSCPKVQDYGRITDTDFNSKLVEGHLNHKNYQANFVAADNGFLRMFSFELVKRDLRTALTQPGTILLTQKMAEKYFGNTDSMGKVITHDKKYRYEVIGIIKIHRQILHCNLTFWTIYNLTKRMKREVWLYTWIKYNWKNNYRA